MKLFITFCVWAVCTFLMWIGSVLISILLTVKYEPIAGESTRTEVQVGLSHFIMCVVSAFLLIALLVAHGVL